MLKYEKIVELITAKGGKLLSLSGTKGRDILKLECKRNHIWETEVRNVVSRGSWCPKCARMMDEDDPRIVKLKQRSLGDELISVTNQDNSLLILCRECDTRLPATLENFAPRKTKKGIMVLETRCRPCKRKKQLERLNAGDVRNIRNEKNRKTRNTDEFRQNRREYYNKNKDSIIKLKREYSQNIKYKVRAQMTLANIKRRCKKKNLILDSTLTVDYLENLYIDNPTCNCCKVNLNYDFNEKGSIQNNSPTLDRIIPSDGYTINNTIILCWLCNRVKNDHTPLRLEIVSQWMRSLPSYKDYP